MSIKKPCILPCGVKVSTGISKILSFRSSRNRATN
nr:MAG TPA: hypothetical protein [Caudoviricetes sp.]